jgi:predicted tellurium resistance membrane protein TerC
LTFALDIKGELNNITTDPEGIYQNTTFGDWKLAMLSGLLKWFKEELLSVVEVVVIWVLIWLGFKMIMARWNPEEFKKAWLWFVYVILWIFFIFAAWWLVKLVSSLSL